MCHRHNPWLGYVKSSRIKLELLCERLYRAIRGALHSWQNELIESASKPNSPDTITDEQLKECNLIAEQIQNQTQKQIEEF